VDAMARSMRFFRMRTNETIADVKSCGPDIPVLVSSWRRSLRIAPMTGARQPVPGETTYKR
jgi:hypothetical protein